MAETSITHPLIKASINFICMIKKDVIGNYLL
jgi:hypothetical protein